MKNSIRKLSIGLIGFALSLGSCSRQTTSLQQVNKLADAQTLQNVPVQKPEQNISPKISIQAPSMAENPKTIPLNFHNSKTASVSKKIKQNRNEHILAQKAARTIVKQANSVLKPGLNPNISSYSGTSHTEGWLGFAIVCLIIGAVLLFLGFGLLGALFWAIGIIVLVVGLVFFILWLLASAVEG